MVVTRPRIAGARFAGVVLAAVAVWPAPDRPAVAAAAPTVAKAELPVVPWTPEHTAASAGLTLQIVASPAPAARQRAKP